MKITLKGNPRSTGTLYKTMCRGNFPNTYMTNEGKALKDDYKWQLKSQWKQKPIKQEIFIFIALYFGNKRKNDIDNFGKILLDSFTGIVWEDDSQIIMMSITKHYDKENPRIEIDVSPT